MKRKAALLALTAGFLAGGVLWALAAAHHGRNLVPEFIIGGHAAPGIILILEFEHDVGLGLGAGVTDDAVFVEHRRDVGAEIGMGIGRGALRGRDARSPQARQRPEHRASNQE